MTWKQVLEILEDEFLNQKESIETVDLIGGEPLLNFELIPLISNWVWEHSPQTKMFARTNGTMLDDEKKRWFADNKERFILGLSMDGTPEVNYINRGVKNLDYDFFATNWPDNPIKMTFFPNSIHLLADSAIMLYEIGYKLTGGLALGVLWDIEHCRILDEQLSKLVEYYIEHPTINPMEPIFDLNFEKAFWVPNEDVEETPCWEHANIHSYDCDGERLPCHMFSKIVQGDKKRERILEDMKSIHNELVSAKCIKCPIRWCCKNCMAMNYQHTGDFGNNINLDFMCEAQMVAATASAKLIVLENIDRNEVFNTKEEYERVKNAIRFLKIRKEVDNG